MFTLNKLFVVVVVFAATLGFIAGETQVLKFTDVERNIVGTNPAQIGVLTQLNYTKSATGDAIYSYKCTVGTHQSNRVACSASDSTSWSSPHDVQLKLRCPNAGSGLTLSYVEILYSVSAPSVNCYVHEGAVGLGYIGVTVNAWNTLLFTYSAKFFSY